MVVLRPWGTIYKVDVSENDRKIGGVSPKKIQKKKHKDPLPGRRGERWHFDQRLACRRTQTRGIGKLKDSLTKKKKPCVTHAMSRSHGCTPRFWAAWVALYNKQLVAHEREKNEYREERGNLSNNARGETARTWQAGSGVTPENCARACVLVLKLQE